LVYWYFPSLLFFSLFPPLAFCLGKDNLDVVLSIDGVSEKMFGLYW
jgi:hypothetical protein